MLPQKSGGRPNVKTDAAVRLLSELLSDGEEHEASECEAKLSEANISGSTAKESKSNPRRGVNQTPVRLVLVFAEVRRRTAFLSAAGERRTESREAGALREVKGGKPLPTTSFSLLKVS